MTPDSAIERAKTGDTIASGELYDCYAEGIYNVGLRLLGTRQDAEDLVHDVFVGLRKILGSYAGRGSFAGWLNRVATRTALMKLRRGKIVHEVDLDSIYDGPHEEITDSSIERLAVEHALSKLTPSLRVVFVLKELEGYSHSEIAEMEDITVANSKVRFFRARERLRTMLEVSK